MQRQERVLRELCVEIAKGDIGGDRFTSLLLEIGVCLDDVEWEAANRLIGRSEQLKLMTAEEMQFH